MQLYLDTIHAYAGAIKALNAEAFADSFTEDAELYDPADREPFRGREGVLAFFNQFEPILAAIEMTPGQIYINGNHAALTWRLEATSKSGNTASAEGIDVIVFREDGKVKTMRAYWNAGPFVATLMDS